MQALFGASSTDLQAVEGVGESRARVIRDGLVRLAESAYTERISNPSLIHDHPEFHRRRTCQLGGGDVRAGAKHFAS